MELKVKTALELFNHLKSLNGRETVVETEDRKRIVVEPYQFDARTCWLIAKNLNAPKPHIETFEAARASLAESIGGPNGVDPKNAEAMEKFAQGVDELFQQEVLVPGLAKFKLAGLNLDKNAIQPGVLASLALLIEE